MSHVRPVREMIDLLKDFPPQDREEMVVAYARMLNYPGCIFNERVVPILVRKMIDQADAGPVPN